MKIGIVGLGIMGSGMARNFLKNDFEVNVWNRTTKVADKFVAEGAKVCDSPAEVCQNSDIVFEVTANDESSRDVWGNENGIFAAADKSKILISSATLSVDWIDELVAECKNNGFTFLDMPLTGGRIGAETGNMTMLVGGEKKVLDDLRPTLKAVAGKIFRFGPAGHGTRYKLLLNMLQAIHMVGYGEVMKVAEKAGMDISAVSEGLADRPGGAITNIAKNSYHNQPNPITFSVEWITKDLSYAKQFSSSTKTPLLDDVLVAYQRILNEGRGNKDWTNVNEQL